MSDATYGIEIVGNNRTEQGARGAERRLGQIPRHVSQVSRRFERESAASLRRNARSSIRTFGEVERAGARIFGGSSIASGITSRLGGVTAGARALGTGLGEAAASGGMLSSTLGVVGVVAGATVGILAAAGYAAFKLADGWAKGAAAIGRTSEIIGVGTKQMQEFGAAAERVGVDKDKATGTLGNLSQTLNDARYGRNPAAMEVLTRLGVKMQTNDDGTVDVGAMLPAIAEAISKKNSSGRRTAAGALGISLEALPVFTQGGKALADDMADADTHAPMISDAEVKIGKRIERKGAMVGQLKDRALDRAGKTVAENAEVGYDAVLSGGQAIMDGASDFKGTVERTFKPAAEKIERAAERMSRAIAGSSVGRFTAGQIASLARRALPLVAEAQRYGFTNRADAVGVAANVMLESGGNHRSREGGGGGGRGLIQITDKARKAQFRRVTGVDIEHADRATQWRYIHWETQHSEARGWRRAHQRGNDAASVADGYARHVERPANATRDGAERAAVADAMMIKLEVVGLPQGTKVRATGNGRAQPAVSHALAR